MKKYTLIIATAMVALFALFGCEQFTTSYERIDKSEFRMLKYLWEPADAGAAGMADIAPGEKITLTAVFAGKEADLEKDLQWWVSFNVIRNLMGATTVVDSQRLEPLAVINPAYVDERWPHARVIKFEFQIPDSIVKENAYIPETWTDMIPASSKKIIPEKYVSLTKSQIIDTIKMYAKTVDTGGTIDMATRLALIPLLQYFTVPMRVFTKHRLNRYPHTIVSTQYIRYNKKFKTAGIPVNNAPRVDSVVVYKVKGGDVSNFDNKSGKKYETIVLDKTGNSVITVEDGYSYFLDAVTSNIDTAVTMSGKRVPEKHEIVRQFQLDSVETAGIDHSRFMDIDNYNGKITFPTNRRITTFVFWLTVYDEAEGEMFRPEGGTLVEVSGKLVYK
jgi:hypothetical protein